MFYNVQLSFKMWFLLGLNYLAMAVNMLLLAVVCVSGLYFLSKLAKKNRKVVSGFIRVMIQCTTLIYIGLLIFAGFPLMLTVCGLAAQIFHWDVLKTYPYFKMISPEFIMMVAFFLINQYMAFVFFSNTVHPLLDVMTYYTLFLCLVPFLIFLSMSPEDPILPITKKEHPKVVKSDGCKTPLCLAKHLTLDDF